MDDACGAGCFVPRHDGPGAAFVCTGREESPQAQEFIGTLDEPDNARLLQAHLFQEHLTVFVLFNFRNLRLRLGRDDQDLGIFRCNGGPDGLHIGIARSC